MAGDGGVARSLESLRTAVPSAVARYHDGDAPSAAIAAAGAVEPLVALMKDGNAAAQCRAADAARTAARGAGLGRLLMALMCLLGRRAGLSKAMLTVFRQNAAALAFFTGAACRFRVDPCDPEACGDPDRDYRILSRSLGSRPVDY